MASGQVVNTHVNPESRYDRQEKLGFPIVTLIANNSCEFVAASVTNVVTTCFKEDWLSRKCQVKHGKCWLKAKLGVLAKTITVLDLKHLFRLEF